MSTKRIDGNILEAFVSRNNQGSNIKTVTGQILTNQSNIQTNTTNISTNSTNIANNSNSISTLQTTKQDNITGAASTITNSNLTANQVLVSDNNGKVATSSVSTTTLGYLDATSSIQTQLNSKQSTITGGASTITNSNLTANQVLISDTNGKVATSSVSTTTLGYLDATSSIQTQLNSKQSTITGGATTITNSNLTPSVVLVSDANGKVATSSVSTTTLGYLDATSSIQTQINNKQDTLTTASNISVNNITSAGVIVQSLTTGTNNLRGKLTVGNSTDSRGILTNNFTSTSTKSNDTDIQDANRAFANDNVSTTTTNNMISAICLQLAPTLGLSAGRAIGDIMLIRENNTTSSFMFSAFQGAGTYRDLMKIALTNSFIRGALNIGSNSTSITDTLQVQGTTMIGNNLRMNNVSPIPSIPTANDVISWASGVINYWANSVNTSTHTSTSITNKVDTTIQTGLLYSNNLLLQGDGTNAYIRPTNASSTLYLGASNSNYMTIDPTGNINISGPSLTINSGVPIQSSRVVYNSVSWTNQTGPTWNSTPTTFNGMYYQSINFTSGYVNNKIRGTIVLNTANATKNFIRLCPIINGAISTLSTENCAWYLNRSGGWVALDNNSANIFCLMATQIDQTYEVSFEIDVYKRFSQRQQVHFKCSWTYFNVGNVNSEGSFHCLSMTSDITGMYVFMGNITGSPTWTGSLEVEGNK